MGRTWFRMEHTVIYEPKLLSRQDWERYLWTVLLAMATPGHGLITGVTTQDLHYVLGPPGRPLEQIEGALAYFEGRGMIRRGVRAGDAPETIHVVNWRRYQPEDPTNIERQARHRGRQRDVTRDVTADNIQDRTGQDVQDKKEAGGEASSPLAAPHLFGCAFCTYLVSTWADLRDVGGLHDAWSAAFPKVDLLGQAKAAKAWELANPAQKKHNHSKFLQNWFTREQDRGGNTQKTAFPGFGGGMEWGPGHPGWERARESAGAKAKGSAASTKAMLDEKLAVPATTEGERKAVLSRIHALKGNGAKK